MCQLILSSYLSSHLSSDGVTYNFNVLPTPYTPDMFPCDFYMFPKLVALFKGFRCESRDEIYRARWRNWTPLKIILFLTVEGDVSVVPLEDYFKWNTFQTGHIIVFSIILMSCFVDFPGIHSFYANFYMCIYISYTQLSEIVRLLHFHGFQGY